MSRNWPQAELRTALSEEISTRELKVLPILICDSEYCFKIHPFMRDKKYLNWNPDISRMVEELEKTLGCAYSKKWTFTHPANFRGHVWIKIMPKVENKHKVHKFSIKWGRWRLDKKLDFGGESSAILNFKKISESKSWPIRFEMSPSAFVVFGRGNPVIDITKGWKCEDKTGCRKAFFAKRIQSFLQDTKENTVKLMDE